LRNIFPFKKVKALDIIALPYLIEANQDYFGKAKRGSF